MQKQSKNQKQIFPNAYQGRTLIKVEWDENDQNAGQVKRKAIPLNQLAQVWKTTASGKMWKGAGTDPFWSVDLVVADQWCQDVE